MNNKIYGFYHIYLNDNGFQIAQEQLNRIHNSELFLQTDKIFLTIVGNLSFLDQLKFPRKYEIVLKSDNILLFEFPALSYMKSLSNNEDFYAWYIHTKGASKPLDGTTSIWRNNMMFNIFDNYKKNLNALDHGADTTGINWNLRPGISATWQGNFWYATSEFIKTLPEMKDINLKWRVNAERWIGMNFINKTDAFINYFDFYPKCDGSLSIRKINIIPILRRHL